MKMEEVVDQDSGATMTDNQSVSQLVNQSGNQLNRPLRPVPDAIRGFLWSYDINALDVYRDQKRIITNIMVYGNIAAVKWMFQTYDQVQMKQALEQPLPGEWDAKSLHFWAEYFRILSKKEIALKNINPA